MKSIRLGSIQVQLYDYYAAVVGSGAAGLAAAWHLDRLGVQPACLVTEAMQAGTSRNTGSDKQTYYKLSLAGADGDSISEMARTLFSGGCMDGDLARIEAALSAGCFNRLCDLQVPFPRNQYGEAVGYKTDHDPRCRATSAGPLTSRLMTEAFEKQLRGTRITVHDRRQVIRLFQQDEQMVLLCLNLNHLDDPDERYCLIICRHLIWAVGGPAMLYQDSVYPQSQFGAIGLAIEIGAVVKNATEWQYGLASVKPRWNVSGSFQQVLPRYLSFQPDGSDPADFLDQALTDPDEQLAAIFRKGYEWPFDARKIDGSSRIDLLVYQETVLRGRRVFLDFRTNPGCRAIDFSRLDPEVVSYLGKAKALQALPIDRLRQLNQPAIDFYTGHGIDLAHEPLEIRLSAQHHNGGLAGSCDWQSNISQLYPIGEVNGSHGIYRPGGSALNSGQVGAERAAQAIHSAFVQEKQPLDQDGRQAIKDDCLASISWLEQSLNGKADSFDLADAFKTAQARMSKWAGPFRQESGMRQALEQALAENGRLKHPVGLNHACHLPLLCRYRELLITQILYLQAMLDYAGQGCGSRGSFLCLDSRADMTVPGLPPDFRYRPLDLSRRHQIQEAWMEEGRIQTAWRPVRSLPEPDEAFEVVWQAYRQAHPS